MVSLHSQCAMPIDLGGKHACLAVEASPTIHVNPAQTKKQAVPSTASGDGPVDCSRRIALEQSLSSAGLPASRFGFVVPSLRQALSA